MSQLLVIKLGSTLPSLIPRKGDFDDWILAAYIDHHSQDLRREGQDPDRLIAGRLDIPFGTALLQRFAAIVNKAGGGDNG